MITRISRECGEVEQRKIFTIIHSLQSHFIFCIFFSLPFLCLLSSLIYYQYWFFSGWTFSVHHHHHHHHYFYYRADYPACQWMRDSCNSKMRKVRNMDQKRKGSLCIEPRVLCYAPAAPHGVYVVWFLFACIFRMSAVPTGINTVRCIISFSLTQKYTKPEKCRVRCAVSVR